MNPTPNEGEPAARDPGTPVTDGKLEPVREYTVKPPPKPPPPKMVASSLQQFSGPMPPPALLRHYEEICPGSADRMLRMAEQEAEHRRKTETTVVEAQINHYNRQFTEARSGQVCALIITLAALAGGVYTAIQGHEIAGGVIGVGGIGGIVTTFVFGRRSRDSDEPESSAENQNESSKPNRKKRRR